MVKKKRRTTHTSKPQRNNTKVKPEHEREIEGHGNQKPAWQLEKVDVEHPKWGWKKLTTDQTLAILDKLKSYESRTWKEIVSDKKRDHAVRVEDLDKQARERLIELKYDDFEILFRLRFEGKQRLWGIKEGFLFKILWWDEKHTVCPSPKKYT